MRVTSLILSLVFGCACAQSAFALNDDIFDISFEIPTVQIVTDYSSEFGAFAKGIYANEFTYNDIVAFSLGGGENQFVIGLSYAKIISEHQWIKFAAEHFAQDNEFDFISGSAGAFIGQNMTSVAYRYIVAPQTFIKSFNLDGYYGNANNGTFDSIDFVANQQSLLDVRNVVGGKFWGANGGLTFHPLIHTLLRTTVFYDNVRYSPTYNPAQNAQGIGAGVDIEQKLTSRLILNLLAETRQPYDRYAVGLNFVIKQSTASDLDFGISLSHLQSDILPFSSDNRIMLGMNYRWGGTAPTPAMGEMMKWIMGSPSNAPEVYVMKDETIQAQ